ncbi:Ribokinase-like protein [Cucurbitaria berberidis CBS 394.84]|uniref:Ribokinase-like protein n=1 Tax=Cucurbitaria berberidis CBS 394.84 TaxID=1168544 RepID=A0A9P4GAV0_9PLEO|nr:Ribokinase-like protein [Cucurbitaria berberidis CBS 394.84]KAF1842052.1 Ribokinase-like protein [Cucurbitaria berberidis CBS 394.84]
MGSWVSKPKAELSVDTVSLGMVVIDEIRLPSRPPLIDVAGGSGTYATLGSRLFSTCGQSHRVGCLVLAGRDFPDAIREQLLGWQMSLVLNLSEDKLSTRGLLEYEDDTFGPKKFRYTTPPLKASPIDLIDSYLLNSRAFHLLATPEEVQKQIPELIKLRAQRGVKKRPFLVWEPLPAACITRNRDAFLQACKLVDVFSPNHLEMSALFEDPPLKMLQPDQLEAYALEFSRATGMSGNGIVIIRAGEHGSLATQNAAKKVWLPPYYQDGATKVVDPTGAGNTFLGGFIEGWKRSQDIAEASAFGNVAASFALEQIGLPSCQMRGGKELWNGVQVMDRLTEYKALLKLPGTT